MIKTPCLFIPIETLWKVRDGQKEIKQKVMSDNNVLRKLKVVKEAGSSERDSERGCHKGQIQDPHYTLSHIHILCVCFTLGFISPHAKHGHLLLLPLVTVSLQVAKDHVQVSSGSES